MNNSTNNYREGFTVDADDMRLQWQNPVFTTRQCIIKRERRSMHSPYYDLRAPAYTRNLTTLKQFGNCAYKVTQLSCARTKGVELPSIPEKGSVNEEKLSNNIVRARSKVREYGLCNLWDYFLTLTINGVYFDRYGLKDFKKTLSQWLRDYRKKYGCSISYLLIPEQHKDDAWHFHGFISGLPYDQLTAFTLAEHLPAYLRRKLQKGETVYNWPAYAAKFGFVDVEPIHDQSKAVSYITKYITKDLERSVSQLGAHLFYASQGLQHAHEIKRGTLTEPIPVSFSNEHCAVSWFDANAVDVEVLKGLIYGAQDIKGEFV